MYLLAGLGNPGKKYECSYHNVGFAVLDHVVNIWSFSSFASKFDSLLSSGVIGGSKVILLKPYSFMNNSGIPLSQALNFYKIPLDNTIVIHDDADLKLNSIKIKKGGSSAGHNGLKSIDHFISANYWRLRVGIGRSEDKKLADHVLSKFPDIDNIASKIAQNINLIFSDNKSLFIKSLVYQENN